MFAFRVCSCKKSISEGIVYAAQLYAHFSGGYPMILSAGFKARLAHVSGPEIFHRIRFMLDELWLNHDVERLSGSRSWMKALTVADHDVQLPEVQALNTDLSDEKICPSTLNQDEKLIERFEKERQKHFFTRSRNRESEPDIRAVWEPARLQHLSRMLFSCTSAKPSDGAALELLEWIEANRLLHGPHYLSAMECGLRIPVFIYALKLVSSLSKRQRIKILNAVYGHGWWIARRLSLFSSRGNHTICEAVGLVFAGAIFRQESGGMGWLARGIELLEQELTHQILEDGGPAEQSLHYHRFVLDLYWLATSFLESNELCDCSGWNGRLKLGEAFLSAFTDSGGLMAAIGDCDDGYAVAPGLAPRRPQLEPPAQRVNTFEHSGYTIIRGGNGLLLSFDHGPLGMAPLHNHGHADALSLTLSFKGEQLLVDPGTFRYNGVPEWRSYFKGTRAHNTVTVDGLDQAVQQTGFVWSSPYTARLLRSNTHENRTTIEAMHDGYIRLPKPVTHRRVINFSNDGGWIIVKDTFEGKGEHSYELNYHLHPEVALLFENGWWRVTRGKAKMRLMLLDDKQFERRGGEKSPIFGWFSKEYGLKRACPVLQAKKEGPPEMHSFITALAFHDQVSFDVLSERAKEL